MNSSTSTTPPDTHPAGAPAPLAITQGDAAGIGPEIIAKFYQQAPELVRGCFVVGDVATMRRACLVVQLPGCPVLPVVQIEHAEQALALLPRCLAVLQLEQYG